MKPFIGWIMIIFFLTAIIGAFFFLKHITSGPQIQEATPLGFSDLTTVPTDSASSSQASVARPPALPRDTPIGYKEYRNDQFGISFLYPQEFSPQEFVDHGPELTVVFQGGDGQPGFQIYTFPISGTKVTPERFQTDEPSGIMEEPHDTTVDGAQALSFDGFDAKMGKTHEVWFIHSANGIPFLYEVSTYKELSGWLSEIMQTWRFTHIV